MTSEPGGGDALASRLIAQALTSGLEQPVILENRVAIISYETVSKAAPDRYTLLAGGNSLRLLPFLRKSVAWIRCPIFHRVDC